MNCPEILFCFFDPPHPGGGLGVNISKVREISWTVEKIDKQKPPKGVAVGILGGQKIKSPGNVMNCREK